MTEKNTDMLVEALMQKISKNSNVIDDLITVSTEKQKEQLKEIARKYSDVKTHPDYVKKELFAKEKIKLIGSNRVVVGMIAFLMFFTPVYPKSILIMVTGLVMIIASINVVMGIKEENRLVQKYKVPPSKTIAWLTSYRKKAQEMAIQRQKMQKEAEKTEKKLSFKPQKRKGKKVVK